MYGGLQTRTSTFPAAAAAAAARFSSRASEKMSPWLNTGDCDGNTGGDMNFLLILYRRFSWDSWTARGEMSTPWMCRLGRAWWRREYRRRAIHPVPVQRSRMLREEDDFGARRAWCRMRVAKWVV